MHCTDPRAITFMFNGGSSYTSTIHSRHQKLHGIDQVFLVKVLSVKNNETLLSGTLALSIQYILDVAQASCECKSAITINNVIGYEVIKSQIGREPKEII